MGKNILIITGSPRNGGNSDLMAKAFAKGARGAGATVNLFNAAADPVQPCRACDACWSKGKPCVFEGDGFDRLAPMLEAVEVVVLCGPVYWFTFSAQMRAATDKFYAYMSENAARKLKWSGMALLMTRTRTFSPARRRRIAMSWNIWNSPTTAKSWSRTSTTKAPSGPPTRSPAPRSWARNSPSPPPSRRRPSDTTGQAYGRAFGDLAWQRPHGIQ